MARILSQTLIRESQTLVRDPPPSHLLSAARSRPSARLLSLRRRSHRPGKAGGQLVEIDLEAEASAGGEVEGAGTRRIEDHLRGIIARRSAPDWLPFIPGSSYWVPPLPNHGVSFLNLVRRVANTTPLTDDESLSLTTVRGWPSSAYFVEGASNPHPSRATAESDDDDDDDEE